jgi:hypothetical protein
MSVNLAPIVNNAQDNNGLPMVGGWWKICDAGTLNLSTIYTDNTGLVPNTNPVEHYHFGYRAGHCTIAIY